MKHIIHFMPMNSPTFNGEAIRIINGELHDDNDHTFVLSDAATYQQLSGTYSNLKLVPRITLQMVREAVSYDEIVFHSLFLRNLEILFLSRVLLEKSVWCVWGHDLYRRISWKGRKAIRSLLFGWVLYVLAKRKLRFIKVVAASFRGDYPKIRSLCRPDVPIVNARYSPGYFKEDLDRIMAEPIPPASTATKIMIGHSGYPFLQHSKYLKLFRRFRDQDIRIVMPLVYGESQRYIDRTVAQARTIYGDKADLLTKGLPWPEYVRFLIAHVDVAIFDYEHQSALGNIFLLLYLDKKVYLSPSGIIYRELAANGVPVYDCHTLKEASLSQIGTPPTDPTHNEYLNRLFDRDYMIRQWRHLFEL